MALRDKLIEVNRTIVGVLQCQQTLPRIVQFLFSERDLELVLRALRVVFTETVPDIMKMTVNVQPHAFRQNHCRKSVCLIVHKLVVSVYKRDPLEWLVSKQHTTVDHAFACRMKQ